MRTLTPEEIHHVSGSAATPTATATTNLFDPLLKAGAFVLIVAFSPILFPILYGRVG